MNLSAADRIAPPPSRLLGRDALLRALIARLQTESRLLIGLDVGLRCRLESVDPRCSGNSLHRSLRCLTICFVLQGHNTACWRRSLTEMASQLGLRQKEFRRASDLTSAVRGWLGQHDRWLLVLIMPATWMRSRTCSKESGPVS